MHTKDFKKRLRVTTMFVTLAAVSAPAFAQDMGDIIVTARKRQESILNVPVVETAVSKIRLEQLQVTDIKDLPKLAPGLTIGHGLLGVGTLVSIRGIGTSALDPGVDSSTSLVVDGLSLTQGLALNSATFDLQQIEVLKGPQALFYGKSSPAGVIALRTADPTDKFELIGRMSYEFEARAPRAELIVSGPVSSTLKLRLATMYSHSDGFFYNTPTPIAAFGAVAPAHYRSGRDNQAVIRGTAIWTPSSKFNARLKVNYVPEETENPEASQFSSCPGGITGVTGVPRFIATDEDCKLDRTLKIVSYNPAAFPGIMNGGQPFINTYQSYGTLELNYIPVPNLTITSTTALYHLRMRGLVNTYETGASAPLIAASNEFRRHDFTEELRINSDFAGPINFSAGGFYQNADVFDRVIIGGNTFLGVPAQIIDSVSVLKVETYSAFGQLRWKPIESLEIAGGLRWTNESRPYRAFNYLSNAAIPVATPRLHADNVAPEATITYHPTENVTLFGSYKKAYKSGSFSIATPPTPTSDNSFGDEKVEGYELGAKGRLFDRQLIFNIAWYDYRYKGLQSAASTLDSSGIPVLRTINAGSARSYGIEMDGSYSPQAISGLTFNGALNWNHARYLVFDNAVCYTSQTIAQGCDQSLNTTTGLYTAQNLSGTPLLRAPKWQGSVGFTYQTKVANDYKLVLNSNATYSSRYVTALAKVRPDNDQYQRAFTKIDVGIELHDPNDRWEIALIGKNLNNKIIGNCGPGNYLATSIPGLAVTGGTSPGIGPAQEQCFSDPGREVWLRLTLRPFN